MTVHDSKCFVCCSVEQHAHVSCDTKYNQSVEVSIVSVKLSTMLVDVSAVLVEVSVMSVEVCAVCM